MLVIEDTLTANWPRNVDCTKCKSTLRVDLNDLSLDSWKISGHHFDGSAVCQDLITFECPVCGTRANGNTVDPDEVPAEVRRTLAAV